MFTLQVIAAILLFLSAACFFGPQLVIYGPRAVPLMLKQGQARFIGAFLASAAILSIIAPHFGSAVLSGGEAITLVALDLVNMSFGLV